MINKLTPFNTSFPQLSRTLFFLLFTDVILFTHRGQKYSYIVKTIFFGLTTYIM